MKRVSCDVLVIGGGGGGLRAALAAKEENPDLKVVLATKGKLGKSGVTALACSDRMAFHATLSHTEPKEQDSWRYHAKDIYEIGGKVSDGNLAEILANNAADAFHYLTGVGVPFVRKNGLVDQFITDGSDYARACYTGPKTAVHIEEALVNKIKTQAIEIVEHCMVTKLITKNNQVIGALALITDQQDINQALLVFEAKSVILATGGAGKVYQYNVFPRGGTGDAFTLAYDAGAELVNLEFIQIGIASTKTKLNCSGSALRAIPRIINDHGEEFLTKYFPEGTSLTEIYDCVFQKGASWPVTYEHKTHIIDIAVYKEISRGNKVFLDYSANPQGFLFENLHPLWQEHYRSEMTQDLGQPARQASPLNRLREINGDTIAWLKEHGINLEAGEVVEIAACIQHFQGGVKINERAETRVAGLYAVGECAGGQHGANRPGGNALLDCQVFGKIAGVEAAKRSSKTLPVSIDEKYVQEFVAELMQMVNLPGGIQAKIIRRRLQKVMNNAASVVRTETGLNHALEEISLIKEIPITIDENGAAFALETKNILVIAEMIVKAAGLRKESRGPHLMFVGYSANTPLGRKDPEWQRYIVIDKNEGKMRVAIKKTKGLRFNC